MTLIVVFLSGEAAGGHISAHNSFASDGDDKRLPFPHYRLISRYSRLPKFVGSRLGGVLGVVRTIRTSISEAQSMPKPQKSCISFHFR